LFQSECAVFTVGAGIAIKRNDERWIFIASSWIIYTGGNFFKGATADGLALFTVGWASRSGAVKIDIIGGNKCDEKEDKHWFGNHNYFIYDFE
jgi:hypothetical protein